MHGKSYRTEGGIAAVIVSLLIVVSGLSVLVMFDADPSAINGSKNEIDLVPTSSNYGPNGALNADPYTTALYHFDDGTGTNAEDVTGGHNGTLVGGTWTDGRWVGGIELDGVDDYITTPDGELDTENNLTVEVWIRPNNDMTAGSGRTDLVYKRSDTSGRGVFHFTYDHSGNGRLNWGAENTVNNDQYAQAYVNFTADTWYHLAGTVGNGRIVLYLNGQELANEAFSGELDDSAGDLYIGKHAWVDDYYFNGTMDELRISSHMRSFKPLFNLEAEMDVYYPGQHVNLTAAYFDGPANITFEIDMPNGTNMAYKVEPTSWGNAYVRDSNTSALWHFDEVLDDKARDTSGNMNDGNVTGATLVTGIAGNALEFGGSSDYVEVSDHDSLDLSEDFTIEAWIKPSVIDHDMTAVIKGNATHLNYNFYTRNNGGGDHDEIASGFTDNENGICLTDGVDLQTGTWYHVAVVYDLDADTKMVYVNGELRFLADEAGTPDTYDNPLYIGNALHATQYHFNGTIDEVRISSIARDPTEFNVEQYATMSFRVPIDAPSGEYSAYATNDIDDLMANTTFEVLPLPDLKVSDINMTENLEVGVPAVIDITIDNIGSTDLAGNWQLTTGSSAESWPRWSYDMGTIAFGSDRSSDSRWEVFLMDPEGDDQTRLTTDTDIFNTWGCIAWGPNNDYVYYSYTEFAGDSEIAMIGIDGNNQSYLTDNSGDNIASWALSGDALHFAYAMGDEFNQNTNQLYVADYDFTNETNLKGARSDFPRFSPSNDRLVFMYDHNTELTLMDLDGSNETKLFEDGYKMQFPEWMNDDHLVYVSNRDGDYDLYMRDIETGQEILLLDEASAIGPIHPAPDQSNILYTYDNDIYRLNATATAVVDAYVGDPASGGTLIGSETIGIWGNMTAKVSIDWIPTSIGSQDIYIIIRDVHPGDSNNSNNKAHLAVDVEGITGSIKIGDIMAPSTLSPGDRFNASIEINSTHEENQSVWMILQIFDPEDVPLPPKVLEGVAIEFGLNTINLGQRIPADGAIGDYQWQFIITTGRPKDGGKLIDYDEGTVDVS